MGCLVRIQPIQLVQPKTGKTWVGSSDRVRPVLLGNVHDPRSETWPVQEVKEQTEQGGDDQPDGDGPPDELGVAPPIGAPHAWEEIVPVFFFVAS